MKIKNLLLVSVVVLGIGVSSTTFIANADTWHEGTPKSIRGFYGTHVYGADLVSWVKIQPNKVSSWESGMPVIYSKGTVKYKTTGKDKYTFEFNAPASGMFNGEKNMKLTVVKKGKALEVNNDKTHLYYKNYIGKQKG